MTGYLDPYTGRLAFRRPGNWKRTECEAPFLIGGHPYVIGFHPEASNSENFQFSAISPEGNPVMCGKLEISGFGAEGKPVPLSKSEMEHLKRHVRTLSVLGMHRATVLVDAEML